MRYGLSFTFLHFAITTACFVEKIICFPIGCLCTFVNNHLAVGAISRFFILLFCVFLLSNTTFILQCSFIALVWKSGSVNLPILFLFLKTILTILILLIFHICFRISVSISTKTLLEFWLGLHWVYKSVRGELTWFISLNYLWFLCVGWCC